MKTREQVLTGSRRQVKKAMNQPEGSPAQGQQDNGVAARPEQSGTSMGAATGDDSALRNLYGAKPHRRKITKQDKLNDNLSSGRDHGIPDVGGPRLRFGSLMQGVVKEVEARLSSPRSRNPILPMGAGGRRPLRGFGAPLR